MSWPATTQWRICSFDSSLLCSRLKSIINENWVASKSSPSLPWLQPVQCNTAQTEFVIRSSNVAIFGQTLSTSPRCRKVQHITLTYNLSLSLTLTQTLTPDCENRSSISWDIRLNRPVFWPYQPFQSWTWVTFCDPTRPDPRFSWPDPTQ